MGYYIARLQNQSHFPGNDQPTIVISKGDRGWQKAYNAWLSGKNPTDDPRWKLGVFAVCELKRKETQVWLRLGLLLALLISVWILSIR